MLSCSKYYYDWEVPGALTVLCPQYNTRITVRVTYDLLVTFLCSRLYHKIFTVSPPPPGPVPPART